MVKIDNPIKENVVSKNCFCMLRFTLVYTYIPCTTSNEQNTT